MNIYKVVYSDIKDREATHLPLTYHTTFRSFERAKKLVKKLIAQNREVVVTEYARDLWVATYEYAAITGQCAFDFNQAYEGE